MNPTNFEQFKGRCEHWLQEFGLKGWGVRIVFEPVPDCPVTMARTYFSLHDHMASIVLNSTYSEAPDHSDERFVAMGIPQTPDSLALHEVLHLLLADMLHAYTEDNESWALKEEHSVIHALLPSLLKTSDFGVDRFINLRAHWGGIENKVEAIKALRAAGPELGLSIGLAEAKDVVDGTSTLKVRDTPEARTALGKLSPWFTQA